MTRYCDMKLITQTPAIKRAIRENLEALQRGEEPRYFTVEENSNLYRMFLPGLGDVYVLVGNPRELRRTREEFPDDAA